MNVTVNSCSGCGEGDPQARGWIVVSDPLRVLCPVCAQAAAPDDVETLPSAPCRACGPGYRIGDEGCRHDPYKPESGETGICRTCAQPIWWETGEVGGREVVGWSDRIKRGGDSVVCFKAIGYRHVPMGSREEAIYRAGFKAGKAEAWDEGFDAGWAAQDPDDHAPNPYRGGAR